MTRETTTEHRTLAPAGPSPRTPAFESDQMARLLDLQRSVLEHMALGNSFQSILDEVCLLVESMVPGTLASVMRLEQPSGLLQLAAAPSMPAAAKLFFNELTPGTATGSCGNAALLGTPVYICDVPSDERWNDLRDAAEMFHIGACWSIPFRSVENRILGTFAITSFQPASPSSFHLQVLETAAHLASITIRSSERECGLLQWNRVFEDATEGMFITDVNGRIIDINSAFTRITGYQQQEVAGRNPRILSSGRHNQTFYRTLWKQLRETGNWQGEIWNRRKNGEVYPEWLSISQIRDRDGETYNYVAVFSDISPLKQSERQLFHLAHHDALTGLPNRLLMNARLEHILAQAERHPAKTAVMFMDLDHFKKVNDSFGHALGDRLLVEVARRLKSRVRNEDTIARIGGDEFVVILERLNHSEDAATLAQAFIDTLVRPFNLGAQTIYISTSVGITLFPNDGSTAEALLKNADVAMYRAKELGRNCYSFYTSAMTSKITRRLSHENLLRRALDRGEFELHYQPQVRTEDAVIVGAEALIRWQSSELGSVPPSEFIPILEDIGLMERVGEWVLQQACQQLRAWDRMGAPCIRLAVNLSVRQISPTCLQQRLEGILAQAEIEPERLELEITEHNLMESPDEAILLLDGVGDLGVKLAIDDFGTGYSSLARLKQLPVHCLKIDRSLVRDIPEDPNDQAICKAVVALAHSLGMRVVAEGVEQPEQMTYLQHIGCDEVQGYLYGRPVPAGDLGQLLIRN